MFNISRATSHDRSAVTGVEVFFSPDEFIVSKTNAKGIITYANDVFLNIAGYSASEVIGKPHNLIRHPWMPRCVFKLLWDQIREGKEIFAYVVNRTKCGDHYWVLAHVTPSFGPNGEIIGFHSNRRVPRKEIIKTVEALYKDLRSIEDQAETPRAGTELSSKKLHDWVNTNGGNYDALMFSL